MLPPLPPRSPWHTPDIPLPILRALSPFCTRPQTYGFLPDGSGKNLNLPRSVQTPLPGASQCNPASTGAVAAAQTTAVQATATCVLEALVTLSGDAAADRISLCTQRRCQLADHEDFGPRAADRYVSLWRRLRRCSLPDADNTVHRRARSSNSSGSSAAPSGATQTAAMGTPLSRSAPSSTSSSSSSNTAGATPASAAAATSGNTTSGAGAGKAVGVGAAFVAVGAAVVAAL